MDPKHLIQLAVIVELGSVTKAARKLNVTQPTLSQSVRLIEDRVGGAVLRRWRYGVTPTEIGTRLAQEGRQIMLGSERAGKAVREWQRGLSGELRVGVGPMLAATVMGDFFCEALVAPPSYGIKIICEYAARLVERLQNDLIDVAIIPLHLNRSDDGLIRETLFEDRLSVFVGHNNPLAVKDTVAAAEMSGLQGISIGDTTGLFDVTRETLDLLGLIDVTPAIENTGDVNMIFRMLEKCNACCVLPNRLLHTSIQRLNIAPINLTVELAPQTFALWTSYSSRDRPEIVDFRERLIRYLASIGMQ